MAAQERLQLIDSSQTFNPQLSHYLSNVWKLSNKGFDYHAVAVFGSQSTGKSTLLNRLFGTKFDVMNEAARQQTTKGLWLSKASTEDLLVMDVEGTDGRERGEDQDFERKSALFTLATAEIIIVNMWENMVGLYNGANMGLLKTVLEVNLQLFAEKGSPKTLLLFIIRDYTSTTPLSVLSSTLAADLEKIWTGINKPTEKEDTLISEFFDFEFVGLSHKIFAPQDFEKGVVELRDRFINPNSASYLFLPAYKKSIPADGFSHFSATIWDKIVDNRDLDLPTQQQLLAQYRCDEIGRTVFESFQTSIKPYRSTLDSGTLIHSLGSLLSIQRTTHMDTYDAEASRYNKHVYSIKRAEFLSKIDDVLEGYVLQQLRNAGKIWGGELQGRCDKLGKVDVEWVSKLEEVVKEVKEGYQKVVDDSLVDGTEWNFIEIRKVFEDEVDAAFELKKKDGVKCLRKSLENVITEQLTTPTQLLLSTPTPTLWTDILTNFKTILSPILNKYSEILNEAFKIPSQTPLLELKTTAWTRLITLIKDECTESALMTQFKGVFEEQFRYDQTTGLPRLWQAGDDVEGCFEKSLKEVDKIIDLFMEIKLSEGFFDDIGGDEFINKPTLQILTPLTLTRLHTRIKKHAEAIFIETKRSMVATTQVPPVWLIALAFLLGANEIYAVLMNPVYFTVLGLLCAVIYSLWYMGMLWSTVRVARVASNEMVRQVGVRLKESGIDVFGEVGGVKRRAVVVKSEREVEMDRLDKETD